METPETDKLQVKLSVLEEFKFSDAAIIMALTAKGLEPCSLAKTPGDNNWIEDIHSKLPTYICNVAKEIVKNGHDTSTAIAMAISQIKKWITNPKTSAETKAKASAAIAEWEKLKAESHAHSAAKKLP